MGTVLPALTRSTVVQCSNTTIPLCHTCDFTQAVKQAVMLFKKLFENLRLCITDMFHLDDNYKIKTTCPLLLFTQNTNYGRSRNQLKNRMINQVCAEWEFMFLIKWWFWIPFQYLPFGDTYNGMTQSHPWSCIFHVLPILIHSQAGRKSWLGCCCSSYPLPLFLFPP